MTKFLNIFDLVPGWIYAIAIAACGLLIFTQSSVIDQQKLTISDLNLKAEKLRADRELVARQAADQLRKKEQDHAERQQTILDDAARRVQVEREVRARELARVERMHSAAASAAARDLADAKGDAAASARAASRISTGYELLAEGVGLVLEGRSLLATCSAENAELIQIINNDRRLLDGKTTSPEN